MPRTKRQRSPIGLLVDQAASHTGLTKRDLARRAGIAPETLSRICGRGTGDFETVAKVVRSAGLQLIAAPAGAVPSAGDAKSDHGRLDARSLALHALVAGKILAQPALVESRVLPNIRRFKQVHANTGTVRLLEAWERAARAGVTELVSLCVDPSETGQQLRQASPMTGMLLPAERRCVYDAFAA